MSMLLESLDRTLLLMRDEFGKDIGDATLLAALTGTRVALIADAANIASHSAQTAFITAAMLMARSGHQVFLEAPDVEMLGPQPPLPPGTIVTQLARIGEDILPGVKIIAGRPDGEIDLAIGFGNSPIDIAADRRIRLDAEDWAGILMREDEPHAWGASSWPYGGLAAAGLAAGEAFKVAMHKLLDHALSRENTAASFAFTDRVRFQLAPQGTGFCRNLGAIDCISGGAITNAILFCLARIPEVVAHGRIIEPEKSDLSNLNRYMLLLCSSCGTPKAEDLRRLLGGSLRFEPIPKRYDTDLGDEIAPLAPTVVVGVDHIPTRWLVQQAMPDWLVIGATSHWGAMASYHAEGLGCAQCLHYRDDPGNEPIPTTACVSFWSGLLASTYVVRHAAGETIPPGEQQVYLAPFRPERPFRSGVKVRANCPTCQSASARHIGHRSSHAGRNS